MAGASGEEAPGSDTDYNDVDLCVHLLLPLRRKRVLIRLAIDNPEEGKLLPATGSDALPPPHVHAFVCRQGEVDGQPQRAPGAGHNAARETSPPAAVAPPEPSPPKSGEVDPTTTGPSEHGRPCWASVGTRDSNPTVAIHLSALPTDVCDAQMLPFLLQCEGTVDGPTDRADPMQEEASIQSLCNSQRLPRRAPATTSTAQLRTYQKVQQGTCYPRASRQDNSACDAGQAGLRWSRSSSP